MHLKKIKLAGFKSFVDPTTVPFRSNRTAIVGPNGCGKSNIIDAVRWVMGESSAKQLRGESMADVIFNGTSARKPVGQASIELFFDNADTPLVGEYAKYNEIAIRREVTREGMSTYYLNSTRCRRKDIVDVFLGTGLGPRSYAIIEQGMISQLIEAKPDDLRVHLEEAAGISKYKERRRETENRIRHTRDNLERLNDIREELAKQLRHLKRQANAATRYKQLKQEQRLLKAQQQALHWQAVNAEMQQQTAQIKQQELNLEAKLAEESKVSAAIEHHRVELSETNDIYHEVQGRHYGLGAEIGRVEQQIQHSKERCAQLGQDLLEANETWEETQRHIKSDRNGIEQLNTELAEIDPKIASANQEADFAAEKLLSAEQTMNEWQIAWDSFTNQAAQSAKQAEVEQTRIAHLDQRISQEQQQLAKLANERSSFSNEDLAEEISQLTAEYEKLKLQVQSVREELTTKQQAIVKQREHNSGILTKLDSDRQSLQQLSGRYASLEALQQAALGKNDKNINQWLQANQLADQPRLVQKIKVHDGWDKAVETVLGNHLQAVCVTDINANTIVSAVNELTNGSVTLLDISKKSVAVTLPERETLAGKVESDSQLAELLGHIYIAENLNDGLQLVATIAPHESVVLRDGIWLGRSWVCINGGNDSQYGVLQREQELQQLQQEINLIKQQIVAHEAEFQQAEQQLQNFETEREQLQQQLSEINAAYSDVYANLTAKNTQLEHTKQRQQAINQEILEHQQRLASAEEQLVAVKEIWQQAEQEKLSDNERKEVLLKQRDHYRENLNQAREVVKQLRHQADELVMRNELLQKQRQYLQQNLARSTAQIANLEQRKESLTNALAEAKSPLSELNQQLASSLEKRLLVENELAAARKKVEEVEHQLRNSENSRVDLQNQAQKIRSILEQLRVDWKALQVRANNYEEQIKESDFILENIIAELPEEATIVDWNEWLEKIAKRIERLGPINLAAIDEYEQSAERKQYLDAQNDDLVEALTTLENAMQKIDRETKARFKATFETVNSEFSRLFPLVFGGGRACLEMTDNNLLSTGIIIQAQPPGKRNSTIHLLSGGEKALTAIALVFAIFQLNPAPFCMLDEVDAPLDDSNVGRFCNLVKEMSAKIQFIFISHNKVTMEMADQLAGVTMHEPGVSRLVSVDIEEAINMAEK